MLCGCLVTPLTVRFEVVISGKKSSLTGVGESETHTIPFRLKDDLQLVLTAEKKLTSLCEFIHKSVTVGGIADFELADHQIVQKQAPVTYR